LYKVYYCYGGTFELNGCTVSIKNVSKTFGSFQALDEVGFTIEKGEFFSLLGPSGCGKTTLLRIIAGFEFPDEGTVLFDDKNVIPIPPNKRESNTVFQNYALFPHLSIYENIAFPLRLKKMGKTEIDQRVEKYLNMVQLNAHAYKKPNQLSGGQRQRVAIARALINEPKVLLLDEPLSALDAKLRSNLLIELDNLHDKIGITFIYVTHDQAEALSVSDRIAVMNQGKVLQIGTPYEIYESPATEFVAEFIGETNSLDAVVKECTPIHDKDGQIDEYMCSLEVKELGTTIKITDYDKTAIGQEVCVTIRPEKVRITLEPPQSTKKDLNVLTGVVEEPVYSGFQSKFYVRLDSGSLFKIYKQHSNYLEDGPEIEWKDRVYVSFSPSDGYVVEEIDR